MKKRIFAFYDVLISVIVASILWTTSLIIMANSQINDFKWLCENFGVAVCCAVCFVLPVLVALFVQWMIIDLRIDKLEAHYLVNFNKNDKDILSNWMIFPSEVVNAELVKLSKEEKRKYTSAKFMFSKYIKVDMRYGHCKYLYVSHFSNYQIKKIIKMLTNK